MTAPAPIMSLEEARAEANPWPTLLPLTRPAPPPLDLDRCIPPHLEWFRSFCSAVAESLQVPQDAVPPLALALASIGTSRSMEIFLAPNWCETAPLWFAVLAESGERKSALLGLLAAPVYEWQRQETDRLRAALASYNERREDTAARLAAVRSKLARATGPDRDALENETLDLAVALETLPPLASPSLITSDATPEAMRDLLARNAEKLGLVSAEVDAAQLLGNRYSKTGGANFDLPLKCFTGDPVTAHRIGREVALARPALALALFVQPSAVADVLRDSYAQNRGLVPRLCLIAPPSRMGSRVLHPPGVPPALLGLWGDTLRRLLDLPWPGRVMQTADGLARSEAAPHVMHLSPEAVPIFDVLRADIESRIGEGGDLRPICGFASKLPGVVARIALTLEAMHNPATKVISAETMRAACEWAPFLLEHFRAVMGDAAEDSTVKQARRLLNLIKRHGLSCGTARDLFRLVIGPSVPTVEVFSQVLTVLVERGYLRELPKIPQTTAGHPPSPMFEVNPCVHEPYG